MGTSSQARESLIAVGSETDTVPSATDDQLFLLHFIMGSYFAPDLKGERLHKPVLQRHAEGLPLYTADQLASSHLRTEEVERIYYYVLRRADPYVVVKLPCLHLFFHGLLPNPRQNVAVAYPQFDDLFPLHLHPHSLFQNRYRIIDNIVFINNPEISYMKPKDVERFMRLTRLEHVHLDKDAAKLYTFVDAEALCSVREVEYNGDPRPPAYPIASAEGKQLKHFHNPQGLQQNARVKVPDNLPHIGLCQNRAVCNSPFNRSSLRTEMDTSYVEKVEPRMIFLSSCPTEKELSNVVSATKNGVALTGSAAMGQVGPVLGLVDIGECEDAYLFRVSLPGVKRDERDFSCEVGDDGKVLIRGVTTCGEKTVSRYSQVFEMQSQNLCPPGQFSMTFKLPGPIDPQHFAGSFGTDGILEGIVLKEEQGRSISG